MAQSNDLTGMKFGTLTVLHRTQSDPYGRARWMCVCVCGKRKPVQYTNLINGSTTSCGRHGATK